MMDELLERLERATGPDRVKLADCTKNQRKWLSRRVCWLCEMPLHRDGCGAVMSPACTPQIIEERRASALKTYRARSATTKAEG